MKDSATFKIRDKRQRGWFYLDNDYLNGFARFLGPIGTAIYVSLCRHADISQKCFPSNRLIAKELNIGERTVRNYIRKLEKWNIIFVERERDWETKKFKNNIYYLLDRSEWKKPEATDAFGKPEASHDTTQRQITTKNQRHQLPHKEPKVEVNTLKKTQIASANADAVWRLEDKLKEMLSANRRDLHIIALYYLHKKFRFENRDQFNSGIKRDLRAAGMLKGYADNRIAEVMEWLDKNLEVKWTLETVHKYIDENLEKMIARTERVVKI